MGIGFSFKKWRERKCILNISVLRITIFNVFLNNMEQRINCYIFNWTGLVMAGKTTKIKVLLNGREK